MYYKTTYMNNEITPVKVPPEKTEPFNWSGTESFPLETTTGKTTGNTSVFIPSLTAIIFLELFILAACMGVSLLLGEMLGKS
jgi:hypothetical protein